jgi:hypothetical protein
MRQIDIQNANKISRGRMLRREVFKIKGVYGETWRANPSV